MQRAAKMLAPILLGLAVWLLPAVYLWNWAHQLERSICGVQDE